MSRSASTREQDAPLDRPREAPSTGAGEELVIEHLEHDQLVAEKRRPVPRAELSRRAAAGLWALRIAVVVLSAMVLYAFVDRLA